MNTPVVAPFGTWDSPVTSRLAARDGRPPDSVRWLGEELWWAEPRPAEGGRTTLMRRAGDGVPRPVLPLPWSARTRVTEYGGSAWTGAHGPDGPLVVFVNESDQRLYRWTPGQEPRPLTPPGDRPAALRHADPVIPPGRDEVWCVREEHFGPGPQDVRRAVVAVPLDATAAASRAAIRELARGRFLTGVKVSPDGRYAAWLGWEHPAMPWDAADLRVARITEDGGFAEARTLCGGPGEPVAQVEWSDSDTLLVAMDRTGWWNIHRVARDSGTVTEVCPREEEFAGPLWRLGSRWFAPLDGRRVAVLHGTGPLALGVLDLETGELSPAAGDRTEWTPTLAVAGSTVAGVAASPLTGFDVVCVDTATGRTEAVGTPHRDVVDPAYLPRPRHRTFPSADGRSVHAYVFPPTNPRHRGGDEPPPFIVWPHGGPTNRFLMGRDLTVAYFTSRGIGVVQVDYAGSTGYGRAYRERLNGRWGVADVEDCEAVARALADEGTADPRRIVIRGASAGGWTAAVSLAVTDTYRCAVLYFPVLSLSEWAAQDTHDLESHYLTTLVGGPEEIRERCAERSPVNLTDRLTAPFLLVQGLQDAVCPPVQCERFLERVRERGVPHTYLTFPTEGHGFRDEETLTRSLEAELSLYGDVLGFETKDVTGAELPR
ncbi:prolyl oligopeptidase family serine peptidase [Streptomyces eurythermus]|uniref:prolyl oligopeptidase family serine peptidase n=1 Tax=Streptomyces eurythermus TaxID=42237 RepID=UPI0033FDAD06